MFAIFTGRFIFDFNFLHFFFSYFKMLFKILIKLINDFNPIDFTFFDMIEVLFHFGSEFEIKNIREKFTHQSMDNFTELSRNKAFIIQSYIASFLNGIKCWSICGWTAYAQFFKRPDESCFRIPWRWLSKVLLRFDVFL